MRNIKLTIEYDGTSFNGWQIQGACTRTVQGEMEKALKRTFKKRIRLTGSGRTDSGAHALGQVAAFKTDSRMTPEEIRRALNAHLPADIVVLAAAEVPAGFHPRFDVRGKTYRYLILNRETGCAQQRNFCLHFPYRLNMRALRQEARQLIGRKDFRGFMAADPRQRERINAKDTVRTIRRVTVQKKGDLISIDLEGNGFLYKMVRNIVGTLLAVGAGRLPGGTVRQVLQTRNRVMAGETAPAHGLCLVAVTY